MEVPRYRWLVQSWEFGPSCKGCRLLHLEMRDCRYVEMILTHVGTSKANCNKDGLDYLIVAVAECERNYLKF